MQSFKKSFFNAHLSVNWLWMCQLFVYNAPIQADLKGLTGEFIQGGDNSTAASVFRTALSKRFFFHIFFGTFFEKKMYFINKKSCITLMGSEIFDPFFWGLGKVKNLGIGTILQLERQPKTLQQQFIPLHFGLLFMALLFTSLFQRIFCLFLS